MTQTTCSLNWVLTGYQIADSTLNWACTNEVTLCMNGTRKSYHVHTDPPTTRKKKLKCIVKLCRESHFVKNIRKITNTSFFKQGVQAVQLVAKTLERALHRLGSGLLLSLLP